VLLLRKGHCSFYFPQRSTAIPTELQLGRPLIAHCGCQAFGLFASAHNSGPCETPKEQTVSYVCRIVGDVITIAFSFLSKIEQPMWRVGPSVRPYVLPSACQLESWSKAFVGFSFNSV
jgi:hypothetical protein